MAERNFVDALREIRRGAAIDELSEELRNLVAAVRATGASGELARLRMT